MVVLAVAAVMVVALAFVGVSIVGIVTAFQVHWLTGVLSLLPSVGFAQGIVVLAGYNLAEVFMRLLGSLEV
jgi:hypothetical protein